MKSNQLKYIGIIALLAFLPVSFYIISLVQEKNIGTSPHLTNFDKSILGTRLDSKMLKTQHIHADFAVFINDKQVDFNNPKYFLKSAFMHVERDDNRSDGKKLHIHSTNVPLWVFFESIGMSFNRNCITLDNGDNFCGTGQMKFYVNDRENNEYENYVFKDGDRILISFGSSDIQKELNTVTDFASRD